MVHSIPLPVCSRSVVNFIKAYMAYWSIRLIVPISVRIAYFDARVNHFVSSLDFDSLFYFVPEIKKNLLSP